MTPRIRSWRDDQRRAAFLADGFDDGGDLNGQVSADPLPDAFGGPFANVLAIDVEPAHAGLGGEGDEGGMGQFVNFPSADAVFILGEDDDAAAFRGLVGETGELGGLRKFPFVDTGGGNEFGRFPVAQGDGPGFVQEQDVDVAGGFDGASAHGENIFLDHAVDTGDADGRQQPADRRGNEADEEGHEDGDGEIDIGDAGINAERL